MKIFPSVDDLVRAVRLLHREALVHFVILVLLFKIGSFPPELAIDDIHFPILVEVPKVRPLRPEMSVELQLGKLTHRNGRRTDGLCCSDRKSEDDKGANLHEVKWIRIGWVLSVHPRSGKTLSW